MNRKRKFLSDNLLLLLPLFIIFGGEKDSNNPK
jgi:hypothetical protein